MPRRGDTIDWKSILLRTTGALERRFDQFAGAAARARSSALALVPYRGFGTPSQLMLSGRVLAMKSRVQRATDNESIWRNLFTSYHRMHTDEIPGAKLLARFQENFAETHSDEEGYFHISLVLPQPLEVVKLWHHVTLELLEPRGKNAPVTAAGEVLIPPPDAEFGIISDLDDTVIQTGATNIIRMLRTTLLESARTRLPFEGVAQFYQALHRKRNPIFYVSSSPWNLYDLLTEFLAIQEIPAGPLMLGDFGFDDRKWIHTPHVDHKHQQIQRVFDTYPDLQFVLIGDSGQQDPEIYWEVVRTDPSRVRAVIIRDVTTPQRDAEVHKIAEKVSELGVEMALVSDTAAALSYASRHRLLPSA